MTPNHEPIGRYIVFTPPLILLIIANLLPIAGAIQFGWNLFGLLLLYWAENAIIGLYTIAKMLRAAKQGELGKSRSYQVIFFVAHYSSFVVLHGVALIFIFQMLGSEPQGIGLLFAGALMLYALQHSVSHRMNWIGRAEFEQLSSAQTMVLPYVRVAGTLALTLVGGIAVWRLGQSPLALAVLAALKLVIDAASHVLIHRALSAPAGSAAE